MKIYVKFLKFNLFIINNYGTKCTSWKYIEIEDTNLNEVFTQIIVA